MLVDLRGIQIYLNFVFLYKYSMVELLQAMAVFFNVFIYCVFLGKNLQICGGNSLASPNQNGSGSSQYFEGYRCLAKN